MMEDVHCNELKFVVNCRPVRHMGHPFSVEETT